ncbi:hypothetical protein J3A78_003846 [Streptomyces sp. PvR006]|uniref:hypothetical protein n=1 Tax=Streptomyces sp. PvR006 TaxID=2817860 RepID=UPI001AE3CB75|nr:hypothetical protein [Streptomyces sp. PvR006]MBP2583368.1 hypothetical protein [Streptomyces sp. PvR006]
MTTAAAHLDYVLDNWPVLQDAVTTPAKATGWPPAMGVARILSEEERIRAVEERLDTDPSAFGPRPVPIAVDILDILRAVEQDLVGLADEMAAAIQRPVLPTMSGGGWRDDAHRQLVLLSAKDSADPRRWRYSGQRDLARAAEWIAGRVAGAPGPFRLLLPVEQVRVDSVVQACADQVRRALGIVGIARREQPVPFPCTGCAGQLVVCGGDGQPPTVECRDCGRTWTDRAA